MCEYSLEFMTFHPASVGDRLVTVRFPRTLSYGFALASDPNVPVCVSAGTELAFENELERRHPFAWFSPKLQKLGSKLARFGEINLNNPYASHDALELPNGRTVLLTHLSPGQRARVLQLPARSQSERAPATLECSMLPT